MATLSAIIFAVVEAIGIITAFHAILHIRSSQGAVAWTIVLITFPWVGLPLYWVFGRNKFKGYIEALRAGNTQSSNLVGRTIAEMEKFPADENLIFNDNEKSSGVFSIISGMPFTGGNHAKLLINGEETFNTIFEYIKNAEHYILLEFFIVRNDKTGNQLKKLLMEKAKEGVKVYFLYDEIGSRNLDKTYIDELASVGASMIPFLTTRGRSNRFQLNFRNHRKIVIIDGKSAFVGGHNIGDEYLGRKKPFGKWRDTHMLIQGPAVLGIQLTFTADWFWASRKMPNLVWKGNKSEESDMAMLPIPTDPSHKLDTCLLFFFNAIMSAKKRIWIASPYFVPDDSIIHALQLAALRGVDIKIILPGIPDKKVVYYASISYFPRLLMNGIKIYRYTPGFMHQKVMLIDDDLAAVGSANLDNRSFYLNFEMTVLVKNKGFASDVQKMLSNDIKLSKRVIHPDSKNNWFFRLIVRFASLFSPVL